MKRKIKEKEKSMHILVHAGGRPFLDVNARVAGRC
jgi:hypothetical protein